MTVRVGPKGQVVLPKRVRDVLGIRPGDEVVVEEVAGEARIRRVDGAARMRGMLGAARSLQRLEEEHLRELERDARRRDRGSG